LSYCHIVSHHILGTRTSLLTINIERTRNS
jgi:hypothetical protein